MSDKDLILLPTGRVIGGQINKRVQQYNQQKKEFVFNDDGSPKMTYYFQIAIPKNSPLLYDNNGVAGIFRQYIACANRQWPQDINEDGYSWKIKDGDGFNNGKPFPDHAHGCYIFTVSSGLESIPKLIEPDANNNALETQNVNNFYPGCHVKVGVTLNNNGLSGAQAGIYVNPEFVILTRHDETISPGGMSLNEISAHVGNLEPVVGSPTPTQMQQPVSQQAPQPTQMQQPVSQQAPQPVQMQQPVLQQAPQPTQMQQPVSQPTMTSLANGLTREQYHHANWSDQQLIDAGLMNAPPHETILN